MSTLFIMVGIPGSGKSTVAQSIAETKSAIIISSDDIREELYGDASIQGNPKEVFALVNRRVKENLASGYNVIYDATSITPRTRKNILKNFSYSRAVCVYLNTPLKTCLERNSKRDRIVPEEVIRRMYFQMKKPTKIEGFDKIIEIPS